MMAYLDIKEIYLHKTGELVIKTDEEDEWWALDMVHRKDLDEEVVKNDMKKGLLKEIKSQLSSKNLA